MNTCYSILRVLCVLCGENDFLRVFSVLCGEICLICETRSQFRCHEGYHGKNVLAGI